MENACWSRMLAEKAARALGYKFPNDVSCAGKIDLNPQAQNVFDEVMEAFRYLPPEQIQLTLDFAEFLGAKGVPQQACSPGNAAWVAANFREIRDLVQFLRTTYGGDQPADEKDYWTDEDRRDAQMEVFRRLDQEDPYPWEDSHDALPR